MCNKTVFISCLSRFPQTVPATNFPESISKPLPIHEAVHRMSLNLLMCNEMCQIGSTLILQHAVKYS